MKVCPTHVCSQGFQCTLMKCALRIIVSIGKALSLNCFFGPWNFRGPKIFHTPGRSTNRCSSSFDRGQSILLSHMSSIARQMTTSKELEHLNIPGHDFLTQYLSSAPYGQCHTLSHVQRHGIQQYAGHLKYFLPQTYSSQSAKCE